MYLNGGCRSKWSILSIKLGAVIGDYHVIAWMYWGTLIVEGLPESVKAYGFGCGLPNSS